MDDKFASALLALYPPHTKIYGPYAGIGNDGRRHVVLTGDKCRRTISWPKAMMEVKLGRLLLKTELVDHIDDDPTNDTYDNFQILTPSGNMMKGVIARGAQREMAEFTCPSCGALFEKQARVVRHNQGKQGKPGPFCGKSCAGKFNQQAGVAKR